MQIEFELVSYDEVLETFTLDETMHQVKLSDEEAQTYEMLKSSDLHLYNWFKDCDTFLKYAHEVVYQDGETNKIAISDINGSTYRRFYFFKVTSGDTHYEYFKKLFNIFEESDWQDREELGDEILEHLLLKRQELIIDLDEILSLDDANEEDEADSKNTK